MRLGSAIFGTIQFKCKYFLPNSSHACDCVSAAAILARIAAMLAVGNYPPGPSLYPTSIGSWGWFRPSDSDSDFLLTSQEHGLSEFLGLIIAAMKHEICTSHSH